jgi:hypothetical protein
VNDLIDFVARRAGITRAQAEPAVKATLEYFTARLPSPVVGRIHEMLADAQSTPPNLHETPPPADSEVD